MTEILKTKPIYTLRELIDRLEEASDNGKNDKLEVWVTEKSPYSLLGPIKVVDIKTPNPDKNHSFIRLHMSWPIGDE